MREWFVLSNKQSKNNADTHTFAMIYIYLRSAACYCLAAAFGWPTCVPALSYKYKEKITLECKLLLLVKALSLLFLPIEWIDCYSILSSVLSLSRPEGEEERRRGWMQGNRRKEAEKMDSMSTLALMEWELHEYFISCRCSKENIDLERVSSFQTVASYWWWWVCCVCGANDFCYRDRRSDPMDSFLITFLFSTVPGIPRGKWHFLPV